jgi:hypothetical protein
MAYVFKKLQLAITTLLLTVVGQVHGDDRNLSIDGKDGDCCSCEPTSCGKGFVSADLLYWRAFEDGLTDCFPLEAVDDVSSDGNIISRFKGKGKDPRFDWDAGFRLGAGYEFASGWDIAAFWTHFHSHSNRHHRKDDGIRNEHQNRWRLDFEVVDLLVGREFNLGSCFTLTPFGGLRGAKIEQKLRSNFANREDSYVNSSSEIFFSNFNPSSCAAGDFTRSNGHRKQKFLGIGPLIGIEADWNLGCGFSLYANASVAALYGYFHVRLNESNEFFDGADYWNVKWNLSACEAVVDVGLGVRWHTYLCGSLVWLQLGLEHHRYFNQNRFGDYGDLCLDGANFSAGIAF